MKKILCVLSLLCGIAFAQDSSFEEYSSYSEESSSSAYLAIPEGLAEELEQSAKDGFKIGFGIATFFLVSAGGVTLFMHLINRGAGR